MKLMQELLAESAKEYFATEATTGEVLTYIHHEMASIAEHYKDQEVGGHTAPAAPDSSKFKAQVSGMIEHANNVTVHGGQYGVPRTYRCFIKIGGAVKLEVRKEIIADVAEAIDEFNAGSDGHWVGDFKIPGTLNCADGMVHFGTTDGTNWGGVGCYSTKYEAYSQKQYDKWQAEQVNEDIGKPHKIKIEKGLTREEALKKAPWKKAYGDCRGFSYDAKTGEAVWI